MSIWMGEHDGGPVPLTNHREPPQVVIQPKLVVGRTDDPAERDADEMADAVVRRLAEQSRPPASASDVTATPRVQRREARASSADPGGLPASPDVESRIRRASGSGAPLESNTRARFESAMGSDLGDVRIHRSRESDQLNRDLQARAFTTGNDVFFSAGSYSPGTSDGQHLLAHELAHTVQQQRQVRRQVIRRFALDNPDFSKATSMTVFGSGGSGNVAEISDGQKPLIVKVDQRIGNEVVVAGRLHESVAAKSGGKGGYTVLSPGVRLATLMERTEIQQAAARLVDPNQARNFLTNMGSTNEVVIMDKADGRDFDEIARGQNVTTDTSGDTVGDPNSVAFKFCSDPGPLTTLGQALPVDVLMGMYDRLIGTFNPDNFKFDSATQAFGFVDNTQNRDEGYLTTVAQQDGSLSMPKPGFDIWANSTYTKDLISSPKKLAAQMFTDFTGVDHTYGVQQALRGPAARLFEAAARKNKSKMIGWIEKGIKTGRSALIKTLADPLPLVAGLRDPAKSEALQSLIARRHVLKGMKPDKAWQQAGVDAAKLYQPSTTAATTAPGQLPALPATPSAPPRPATAPPTTGGTGGGGWKSAQPSGKWKSAQPTGKWKRASPSMK